IDAGVHEAGIRGVFTLQLIFTLGFADNEIFLACKSINSVPVKGTPTPRGHSMVQILSPIDGSIVAERAYAPSTEIDHALADARTAQKYWRKRSLEDRARYCLAAVDAMVAMA